MPEHVSAEELLEAAEAGRLRIPVEVGAFILLRAVELLSAGPRAFTPADVLLSRDGAIELRRAAPETRARETAAETADETEREPEREAVLSATRLLKRVLLASSGASPSALLRWLERSRDASLGLEAMRDEVEAALVPLNREAATRLLARFIRSSAHLRHAPPAPRADARALDAELDRFLEGEAPTHEPAGVADELVAIQLRERRPRRGPSLALTVTVIALAALLGLALSRLDPFGFAG